MDDNESKEVAEHTVAELMKEPAAAAMAMVQAFGSLPPQVQKATAGNLMDLLTAALEKTTDLVGEEKAFPLEIAVRLVQALFKSNGRVIFLRDSEAGILFHQATESKILTPGSMDLTINFIPAAAGRGERAQAAAGLALKLLEEHARG